MRRGIYFALGAAVVVGLSYVTYRWWVGQRTPAGQPAKQAINGIPQASTGVVTP